jgi:hypothetical protein
LRQHDLQTQQTTTRRRLSRTRLVLEQSEVRIVSIGPPPVRHWCDACAAVVSFVPQDVAARVAEQVGVALGDRARAGAIHISETAVPGRTLVCLPSLLVPPR